MCVIYEYCNICSVANLIDSHCGLRKESNQVALGRRDVEAFNQNARLLVENMQGLLLTFSASFLLLLLDGLLGLPNLGGPSSFSMLPCFRPAESIHYG